MRYHLYLLSSCASALLAMPAAAQTVDTAPQMAESAGDIVVTARRREETLMDVPLSVSAISGDMLTKSGVSDVQGLQYRTPSLSITSAQSQRNTVAFSLRGQRTQETQLFTDPPVGTYFAEVVQPRPYGFGNTFYDLESVQVLKGVQGTLFGRNMTGGAVLVEPAHPKMGVLEGNVRGQYGNFNLVDLSGALNVPVGDIGAIRVSGKFRRRDGWSHDVSGLDLDNQNQHSFRVSALLKPFDGFETLTIFDYYRSKEHGTAAFLTAIRTPSALSNYAGLQDIAGQFAEAQRLQQGDRYGLNIGAGKGGNLDAFGGPFENIRNWGVTNKTTWDLTDTLTLKNIFGYRKLSRQMVQDYDGIPAFLITPYQYSRSRNISEELQLQGHVLDGKLDFIVGGYYFEEKGLDGSLANTLPELNIAGAFRDPTIVGGATFNPRTTSASLFLTSNPGEGYSRTAAGFVAGTFHFTDQISASGGLRYNWDKRKITVSPAQPNIPTTSGIGRCSFDNDVNQAGVQRDIYPNCAHTNQATFKEWTYDGTLQYQPSSAITTYISYRHGFRAGGFSTRATDAVTLRPFQPEFVNEWELGLKTNTRLGAGRLTTATALFQQDGSNVQKQRATFIDGNVFTIVDNTAKQRNRGGEFEFTFNTDTFQLMGFYSYTDVKIREGRVVLNGLREIDQRGVPKHQAGVTATVTPPISEDVGRLNFVVNYTWRSEIFLDDFEIEGRQKPYSLINLRAELNNIGGSGASVAAFVNNALDQKYRIGVLGLLAEGLGFQSSVFGERRMFGMEVGYKF